MKSYIKNKFVTEKLASVLSIWFWIFNFTFAQICINMFIKIIIASKSDWLKEGLERQLTNDQFIINKTELVMQMLMSVLFVIVAFSIISIVFFRNVQLKNMLSQIGIYSVLGYNKKKLIGICMCETIFYMTIAFPVSVISAMVIWIALSKIEMISFMMKVMDDNVWLDVMAYIMCIVVMLFVTIVHTVLFLKRSLKKGIRYMLGQGVI